MPISQSPQGPPTVITTGGTEPEPATTQLAAA